MASAKAAWQIVAQAGNGKRSLNKRSAYILKADECLIWQFLRKSGRLLQKIHVRPRKNVRKLKSIRGRRLPFTRRRKCYDRKLIYI